jgi:hypothetical protein
MREYTEEEARQIHLEYGQLFSDFSLEEYVRLRRKYPEIDVAGGPVRNLEYMFILQRELAPLGIDAELLPGVLDGDATSIDELCLL